MKKYLSALTLASMIGLTGCAGLTSPAREHKLAPNTPYWFDTDASRRGSVLAPKPNGAVAVCAEPSPDVALQTANSIIAEAKVTTGNVTVDATTQLQFQTAVIELTQRTEVLSFLRESLYRLCEQSMAGNLTQADIKDLYEQALKAALTLAQADLAKQQSETAKSLADPKVRALWERVIGKLPDSVN